MPLDAICLQAVLQELTPEITGVKIEKVQQPAPEAASDTIVVVANGRPVTLSGKKEYIYVDIFDYIDFDLSAPRGKSVVTLLNGMKAGYVETLKQGDRIDIYWEN